MEKINAINQPTILIQKVNAKINHSRLIVKFQSNNLLRIVVFTGN